MRKDDREQAARLARGLRQLSDELVDARTFTIVGQIGVDVAHLAERIDQLAQVEPPPRPALRIARENAAAREAVNG